ncbi:serine hydrolase domain-containing protein [Adhaeribacter radiodurans]|uniref:Beta-lactamase family protein n=1 Tax=Adhaeribacter radiodurans TaxID=2745197 RepID=A0A7L7LE81_9BACT|nr:serine hydrolase domain-containing protein [Adhaeribacter radiodurans]QMU31120.1 beta-lactamase family protein [Adhaeribacter radiodurans]
MKKFVLLTCLYYLICTCFAQKSTNPTKTEIDAFVKKEMAEVGIPGLAVAVVKDGKVLHAGTYGIANVEWNQPVTQNTVFHIASVTKLFTSTLVLKWLQENKISLDDYISKYIAASPPTWKDIQIKHLLSHESGIPWPVGNNEKIQTCEELVNSLKDSTLTFAPGTKESYMNGDYFALQHILEKIGGKPIEQLLAYEIFKPLNMNDSGFDKEIRNVPTQLMEPLRNKSQIFTKGKNQPFIFKNIYTQTSYASAGLYLSLADGIKWATALDKATFIRKDILAQVTDRMPLVKNEKRSFSILGWTREENAGHLMVGHSGGPGLGDVLRFPDQKLTIIVLSNYADMLPYLAEAIARLYVKDLIPPKLAKSYDRGLIK